MKDPHKRSFRHRYRYKTMPLLEGRKVHRQIFCNISQRILAEKELQHRIKFDELIADISTKFINLPHSKIDDGINQALQAIGEFACADRSYVFMFYDSGKKMDNTHEWCSDGIEPQIQLLKGLNPNRTMWWMARLYRLKNIYIPSVNNLPNFLPEKAILQPQGIKSLIAVPMAYGNSLVGFLGFDFVRQEKSSFTRETLGLLRNIANTFLNALERKSADMALQKSEEQLRKITDNMQDMISQISADGFFKYASPSHRYVLGYHPEQLVGSAIYQFIHPDDIKPFSSTLQKVALTRMPGKIEFRYRHSDGHYLWAESMVNAIVPPLNESAELILCIRDISERKFFETEMTRLDRLNLVGEMAAGIAHEIRNPMTTVRGFLQILKGKQECTPYVKYYDLMIEELDRANSIITEFLSLAKNKTIELKILNLNQIIKSIFPLLQAGATVSHKFLQLELGQIPDIPLNEKEIRQMLLNLVRNGLESMQVGGMVTLKTYATRDCVCLSVQDQGTGIEPASLSKIGTPFFTTKENGTGLGLAVCYSIANRHMARIELETGPQGTTFTVLFERLEVSDKSIN